MTTRYMVQMYHGGGRGLVHSAVVESRLYSLSVGQPFTLKISDWLSGVLKVLYSISVDYCKLKLVQISWTLSGRCWIRGISRQASHHVKDQR